MCNTTYYSLIRRVRNPWNNYTFNERKHAIAWNSVAGNSSNGNDKMTLNADKDVVV